LDSLLKNFILFWKKNSLPALPRALNSSMVLRRNEAASNGESVSRWIKLTTGALWDGEDSASLSIAMAQTMPTLPVATSDIQLRSVQFTTASAIKSPSSSSASHQMDLTESKCDASGVGAVRKQKFDKQKLTCFLEDGYTEIAMSDCLISRRPALGFSLVEVVIALGIVSFAVLAIVGMMPVAMKSAQDSMRQTDSTLIAQRIFSELKSGSGAVRTITLSPNGTPRILDLSANSTNNFLAFKENGTAHDYVNSAPATDAYDFYAQISVTTNIGASNLSSVQIDIGAPAAAPPAARTTNSFTTLIGF
jgi:uncharacterized protein (TIGR02598 family)